MSKYSKSTGPSFTSQQPETGKLGRGIRIYPGKMQDSWTLQGHRCRRSGQRCLALLRRAIEELADPADHRLLDKVIRKPKTLRNMALETYEDRTHVAVELCDKASKRYSARLNTPEDGKIQQFERLKKRCG
jgi:hypothetical protein